MSCPGDNYVVPGANPCAGGGGGGVAGVTTLNNQSGALEIVAGDGSIVVTPGIGQILLTAPEGGAGVDSINVATGAVTIQGAGITTVTTVGNLITVGTNADVTSLNGQIGVINIQGDPTGCATVQTFGQNINIVVPNPIPATVTSIVGSGVATVTNVGTAFTVSVPTPPSATVTNITGSGVAVVTSAAGVFNVDVPTPPSATVTNILGTGQASISQVGTVFTVDVPVGGFNVTGSGIAVATQPLPQTFNIDVPAPVYPVTSVTGSGVANVTQAGTVVNVDVPVPDVTSVVGAGIASVTTNLGVVTVDVSAVQSLKTLVGNIDLTSSNGSITITEDALAGTIDFINSKSPDVTTLNGLGGDLNITSSDGSLTITPSGTDIDITVVGVPPVSGVTSVNGVDGIMNLTCVGGGISFTSDNIAKTVDLSLSFPSPTVTNITGSGSAIVSQAGTVFNVDVPTIPAFKAYRTVNVLSPTIVEGSWFTIAQLTGFENDFNGATLFWSGNLEIRYDASFTTVPIPPATNTVYGDYIIRVRLDGDPGEYVPQTRKNCLYLPPPAVAPNLVRDVIPFTYYTYNFPTTALGPVSFDLEIFLNNMDPLTTTFTGVDLSVLIIKAAT